jgi:predicted CopG family antitoxin
MSSKIPTPFSAAGEAAKLASSSQARQVSERFPLGKQDSLSEVVSQYAATVQRMEERLEVLSQMRSKNDDSELKAAIYKLTRNNHESLVLFSDIQSSLLQQKQRGVKMLSQKATASMRLNECEKYLTSFLTSENDSSSLMKVQPLDIESESRRRAISSAAMTFNCSIITLKSRAKLLDELQEVDGDMRLLVTINETRKNIQGLEEDVTRVERRIRNVVDCGQDIRNRVPSDRTTKDRSIQAAKGNYRNEVNWKDVENHLSKIPGLPRRTKLELSLRSERVHKKGVERKQRLSSTGNQHQKQLPLFSPPLSLQPRAGWNEPSKVDQVKMQALTYSPPSQLKSFAIDSAARGALSDFGTTPERVRDSSAVSNLAGSVEARKESLLSNLPFRNLPSKSPQSKLSHSPSKKDDLKPSKVMASPIESHSPKFTLKNDADPPLSFSLPEDIPAEASKEKSTGLNSLQGLGTMLFSDSQKSGTKSSLFEMQPSGSEDQIDFHKLLTEFYRKHNASKLSEVPTVLLKYKVCFEYHFVTSVPNVLQFYAIIVVIREEKATCLLSWQRDTASPIHLKNNMMSQTQLPRVVHLSLPNKLQTLRCLSNRSHRCHSRHLVTLRWRLPRALLVHQVSPARRFETASLCSVALETLRLRILARQHHLHFHSVGTMDSLPPNLLSQLHQAIRLLVPLAPPKHNRQVYPCSTARALANY